MGYSLLVVLRTTLVLTDTPLSLKVSETFNGEYDAMVVMTLNDL